MWVCKGITFWKLVPRLSFLHFPCERLVPQLENVVFSLIVVYYDSVWGIQNPQLQSPFCLSPRPLVTTPCADCYRHLGGKELREDTLVALQLLGESTKTKAPFCCDIWVLEFFKTDCKCFCGLCIMFLNMYLCVC